MQRVQDSIWEYAEGEEGLRLGGKSLEELGARRKARDSGLRYHTVLCYCRIKGKGLQRKDIRDVRQSEQEARIAYFAHYPHLRHECMAGIGGEGKGERKVGFYASGP